jgi:predicted Zn-dependent protease
VNGFSVAITRYVGAQQISATNRQCARFWGTITPEEGESVVSPEQGWTVGQIDKIVSNTDKRDYSNRGTGERINNGESPEIKRLRNAIATLESAGLPTDEAQSKLNELIAQEEANRELRKAAIENERALRKAASAENRAKKNALKKEITRITKAIETMKEMGVDYIALQTLLDEKQSEYDNL